MNYEKISNEFLIKHNGMTVGSVSVLEDSTNHRRAKAGERIYLENLFVREEYRRKGYATSLLLYVIGYYKEYGIHEFTLAVDTNNKAAKQLYDKMEFRRIQVGVDLYQNRVYELLLYGEKVP